MILDLFAGPGGWDEGLRLLGRRDVHGVDIDPIACNTAVDAGHTRDVADVAKANPRDYGDTVEGLIASPPCQSFSRAGGGAARLDGEFLLNAVNDLVKGLDPRHAFAHRLADPRSGLAIEPLRYALALKPEWCAWEQVPAVLPVWEACAQALRADGYHVSTGIVCTEQYGLPQTRRRAVLLASRVAGVNIPSPTHGRYYIREPGLMDLHVAPWVAMCEVIDWPTSAHIGFPRKWDHLDRGIRLGDHMYRRRDLRSAIRPANTVTEKVRSWMRWDTPESAKPARVTLDEAAVLQGFRGDTYPWNGLPTQQFRQLANAVPPPLAAVLLAPLLRVGD